MGGGEAWRKKGGIVRMGERHGCWGGMTPLHAGKLDHIGVGTYSTLAGGGKTFFARDYVKTKYLKFYIIFARKSNKIPELFYTRHFSENAQILH